jgi:hypothetical protein
MVKIKLFIVLMTLSSACAISAQPQEEARLKNKITELEQKVRDCQAKKLALLQHCDTQGCLPRIESMQENIKGFEQAEGNNHWDISLLQRTIAEHNRKLLASMSDENKRKLKQLLSEYAQLWQKLCKYDQQDNERQPNTFELFFI